MSAALQQHRIDVDAASAAFADYVAACNSGRLLGGNEPRQRLEDLGIVARWQPGRSLKAREAARAARAPS